MKVRVALNLVFLVPGETGGMEIYARELIARLGELEGVEPVALVNREAAADRDGPWGQAVPMRVVPVNARNRLQWVRGEQQHVPRMAAAEGCALIHSLASTAPLRSRARRVTTIHDLNYKLVPDAHFGLRGLGMRALVPLAALRSHRVIVDAASTRADLVKHLRTRTEKIDVVPLGVTLAPPVTPTRAAELRERLALGDRPVLLSVSAKRPHKNLGRLLEAVAGIPSERRPALVLPGYRTPHEAELRGRAADLGLAGDVAFPAWLPAADLEGLYALATAFVFPSLHEGFGLPVLEAMARGVPVATSARSSLAEVAGDAALLFDPEDVRAIRAAIERLLGDPPQAARLRAAGLERARAFTWERTADLTAASYERALAE
ncbi:MAG TPA: glycosyltransferase family 1 protein [Solirubrobacteraceae bacterium]|nr:glycosyltransferase family 1 protein [Solirubrobacteraceae bacterium]